VTRGLSSECSLNQDANEVFVAEYLHPLRLNPSPLVGVCTIVALQVLVLLPWTLLPVVVLEIIVGISEILTCDDGVLSGTIAHGVEVGFLLPH
jgi:hypothetical protein